MESVPGAAAGNARRIFSRRGTLHHIKENTMADRAYVAENEVERKRLASLVARLSDQDLARPMPGGWTVASVLGHVAFWDQRIIALIEEWRKAGVGTPPKDVDESQVDWINDATKPLLLAVAPRRAAELTVSIAESTDRMVAELPEDFLAANGRAGSPINVHRAEHRREHIDEIETALRS
jgi:uncharacterized damage-inducible protein DinB